MNFRTLLGSVLFCYYFPLVASLKLKPKIVTTTLKPREDGNGSNEKLVDSTNIKQQPTAAFLNRRSELPPVTTISGPKTSPAVSFARQVIVVPAIMRTTAVFLVPCTKTVFGFVSLSIGNTVKGCTTASRTVLWGIANGICKSPGKAMKAANFFTRICTSMVKNTITATVNFGEQIGKVSINSICEIITLGKTCVTFTYSGVLKPCIRNSADFITQITKDVTAWFENVALFAFHFTTTSLTNGMFFIVDNSIDVADWIQYYSTLSFQIVISALRTTMLAMFQTILNSPVYFYQITSATWNFLFSLGKDTKQGCVKMYNDFLVLFDEMVDAAPFLFRYEERGQQKISLTPKAQTVLYILSTIYAIRPMWEQTSPSSDQFNKVIMNTVVSSIQTRFFPARTLFFAGALARGLQQSSSLKETFHPTTGVGAIINFCATALDERWINYIVSGWFISGSMWTFFGSRKPEEMYVNNEGSNNKFW